MKLPRSVVSGLLLTTAVIAGLVISHGQSPLPAHAAQRESGFTIVGEPTDRQPEIYQGSFTDSTLISMLTHAGVSVDASDKVYAFPDPSLHAGSEVRVYRHTEGEVKDGNKVTSIKTWKTTVKDVLDEQGTILADLDVVTPPLSTVLVPNEKFSIVITRVAVANIVITSPIPYTTITKNDDTLEYGTTKVQTAGKNGVSSAIFKVVRENGEVKSQVQTKQETTTAPVTQVIAKGTHKLQLDSGVASFCVVSSAGGCHKSMTAAHKSLPMGSKITVYNPATGKSVTVTINDRGPYVPGRVVDLAQDAADAIGIKGLGQVIIYKYYPPAN